MAPHINPSNVGILAYKPSIIKQTYSLRPIVIMGMKINFKPRILNKDPYDLSVANDHLYQNFFSLQETNII